MAFLRNKAIIYSSASLILLTLIFVGWFLFGYVYAEGPLENNTIVVIEKGNVHSASENLMYNGVISLSSHKFGGLKAVYYLFFSGDTLKAGEYEFEAGIPLYDVLKKMTSGDVYYRQFTVPEGLMTTEVLAILSEQPGLFGDLPQDIKEGELLPETYTYTHGQQRADIVKDMYTRHYMLLDELWQTLRADSPIKTKDEAVILASIIEKETGLTDERDIVASVYLNRLKKGMKLQADPTVAYAITRGKEKMDRELTRKDLEMNSNYNTYKYAGLPPTPICNPGAASLRAVFAPAETDYLYFVATGIDGGHNFAKTLTEHERNVRNYRIEKRRSKISPTSP